MSIDFDWTKLARHYQEEADAPALRRFARLLNAIASNATGEGLPPRTLMDRLYAAMHDTAVEDSIGSLKRIATVAQDVAQALEKQKR